MNKRKLVAVMYEHGDTQKSLAKNIGVSIQGFNKKINERDGSEFTRGEIAKIKYIYNLTPAEIDAIFFT